MTLRKATDTEKGAYRGMYKLSHIVTVDGWSCAVEYLGEGDGGVNYEVILPNGMHDDSDVIHSLCCHSIADVRERVRGVRLAACTEECGDWGEHGVGFASLTTAQ